MSHSRCPRNPVGVGTVSCWVPRGRSQGPLPRQWGHPSGLSSWLLLEPEQLFSLCMELHTDYIVLKNFGKEFE